jgi:hypothetical protein
MMLNFDDEVVQFTLKGKKYQISKPNNGQISKYTKDLEKCETNESKEQALKDFLLVLGLDQECFDLLNPGQLKKLLESLYDSEKN